MGNSNKMLVGINYPWFRYGWDFGPPLDTHKTADASTKLKLNVRWDNPLPTPMQSASTPGVTLSTNLEAQLDNLKVTGIRVVRWFILADGWNLGTPTIDKGKWAYIPKSLDPTFASDFTRMLGSFKKLGMQVIPVLVDFHMFGPGRFVLKNLYTHQDVNIPIPTNMGSVDASVSEYLNTNRQTIVQDQSQIIDWNRFIKGGKQSVLDSKTADQFMKLIFDPLLVACKEYQNQIYAWDICNEPDEGQKEFNLDVDLLASFLFEGLKRVKQYGMCGTIGFKLQNSFASSYFPIVKLIGAQFLNEGFGDKYLPQFHYWPDRPDGNGDLQKQPNAPKKSRSISILGEFGTRADPKGATQWGRAPVGDRLKSIDQNNFGCGLLWAARLQDENSDWTNTAVQNAVKMFVG